MPRPATRSWSTAAARILLQHMADFSGIDRRVGHLHIQVPDVEAAYNDLVAKGVAFSHRPKMVSRSDDLELWKATFRDPDGHGVALTEWRHAPLIGEPGIDLRASGFGYRATRPALPAARRARPVQRGRRARRATRGPRTRSRTATTCRTDPADPGPRAAQQAGQREAGHGQRHARATVPPVPAAAEHPQRQDRQQQHEPLGRERAAPTPRTAAPGLRSPTGSRPVLLGS